MTKIRIIFIFSLLALTIGTTAAREQSVSEPSVFYPSVLDKETVKAATLEALLDAKLKKVVYASGVYPGDFTSSATVHISKRIRKEVPNPDEKLDGAQDPKKPVDLKKAAQVAAASINELGESSFRNHSLLDADDLIEQIESRSESERKLANADDPNAEPSDTPEKEPDIYEYFVDDIYLQAALSDPLYANTHAQVEKALHQSFDILIPGRLKIAVNPFSEQHITWYSKILKWMSRHPNAVMEVLFLVGAAALLILFRLIPSWNNKAEPKAEEKEEELQPEAELAEEEAEEEKIEEPKEEPVVAAEVQPDEPPTFVPVEDPAQKELSDLKTEILTFVTAHSHSAERVVAAWIKDQETTAKINYFVQFLTKNGFSVGHIEIREDQLREMRDYERKAIKPSVADEIEYCRSASWDLITAEHFKQQNKQSLFQFLHFFDDRALLGTLRSETPQVQARVIGAMNEKRAARLISKFSSTEKRKLMECFFAKDDGAAMDMTGIASSMQEKLQKFSQGQGAAFAGAEAMVSILSNLDFNSQFTVSKGLLSSGPDEIGPIIRSYFNVGLLPLAQTSYIEKVFVDQDIKFVKNVLSQFDTTFTERVRECLPPMQKRMLEKTDFSGIANGAAMTDLKELNESILRNIQKGEISLEDIFGQSEGNAVELTQAA
jgi:flagellar motor switch protein FliG